MKSLPCTVEWIGDLPGHLRLLDQTLLPTQVEYRDCRTVEEVWEAIRSLRVRGAPAIGVAAAYGVIIGLQPGFPQRWGKDPFPNLRGVGNYLRTSRPTAVNLFWALERMERRAAYLWPLVSPNNWIHKLLEEARAIQSEDAAMCRAIGRTGAHLVLDGHGILTHCNAGGLATSEYGTALAVLYTAAEQGKRFKVFADETRPLLQGSRLTAWELQQAGIDVTVICDSAAAAIMRQGEIHLVIVGADRIAANGDTANKIGTYGVAVLARAHQIPFYVAAPSSTFDLNISSGRQIPIEYRDRREVAEPFGRIVVPAGVGVRNPAFDVTPVELIAGIITEKGLIQPINEDAIRRVLG
jgi:methylthioribose-1-phosphate isomerase